MTGIFNIKKIGCFVLSVILLLYSFVLCSCNNDGDAVGASLSCEAVDSDYKIVMLDSQSGNVMMSFLIATKGGELFVVDGGYKEDALYLCENIKRYGGHVTGWFITHYHLDHFGALAEILNNDEIRNQIQIDYIYYNFPTLENILKYEPTCSDILNLYSAITNCKLKTKVVDDYYNFNFRSVNVEVVRIFNPDITYNYGNNSSTVYMFRLGNYKMCFLGDLGVEGGKDLLENCPAEKLRCQIVQMAHHGQSGVEKDVYMALNPKICFWPTTQWLWDNNSGEGIGSGPWLTFTVREWIDEIGAISYVSNNGQKVLKLYN